MYNLYPHNEINKTIISLHINSTQPSPLKLQRNLYFQSLQTLKKNAYLAEKNPHAAHISTLDNRIQRACTTATARTTAYAAMRSARRRRK